MLEFFPATNPASEKDPRIPLYHLEGIPVRRCVQSGLCCRKAPCAFGEWDPAAHQCTYLVQIAATTAWTRYACAKKAEIDALPPESGAAFNPAFGGGCCMPLFNENRAALIREAVNHLEHS